MTIELAICIVIILLGVGAYQALASVDFKPIVIKLPERKTKVIQAEPIKVENYWQHWVDERAEHDKTKKKLTKAIEGEDTWYQAFEKAIDDADIIRCKYGLEPIGHNIKPEKHEYQLEDGYGNIFIRNSFTQSNSVQYVSNYLDYVESIKLNKDTAAAIKSAQEMIKASGWEINK